MPLCKYCMNEMRCHVVLYTWLICKEPRRVEYPVQMVGVGQAMSLVRWLLMLGGPFIRSFIIFCKLENRIYRWKWKGLREWVYVHPAYRLAICKSQSAISESINCVAVLRLFNQSLPLQHNPVIATHIFFPLSTVSQVEGFYGNRGRLCAILYMCFLDGYAAWFLSLAWRVQLLIVASLPELLECEWGSPPSLNVCWIMPFKAEFELGPCLILSVSS